MISLGCYNKICVQRSLSRKHKKTEKWHFIADVQLGFNARTKLLIHILVNKQKKVKILFCIKISSSRKNVSFAKVFRNGYFVLLERISCKSCHLGDVRCICGIILTTENRSKPRQAWSPLPGPTQTHENSRRSKSALLGEILTS